MLLAHLWVVYFSDHLQYFDISISMHQFHTFKTFFLPLRLEEEAKKRKEKMRRLEESKKDPFSAAGKKKPKKKKKPNSASPDSEADIGEIQTDITIAKKDEFPTPTDASSFQVDYSKLDLSQATILKKNVKEDQTDEVELAAKKKKNRRKGMSLLEFQATSKCGEVSEFLETELLYKTPCHSLTDFQTM